jgi:hypothetical protein
LTVATTELSSESVSAASGPTGVAGALDAVSRAGAVVDPVVAAGVEADAGAELVEVGAGVVVVGALVGVVVGVGLGVVVPGVGVPVGDVPLVQVTELPSAERTQVIWDPVLPVEVGEGVGVADPLPALGGFGVVVTVVTVVPGCPGTLPGTVVVVMVRAPFVVTPAPSLEGELTLTVREPELAATVLLTALAMATAPAWASLAPAYPVFCVVTASSILRNQSATAPTWSAICAARTCSGVSGAATGPATAAGVVDAGDSAAVAEAATAAGIPAMPRTSAVPAATNRAGRMTAPSLGLGVAVKRWIKPMRLPVESAAGVGYRWRAERAPFRTIDLGVTHVSVL